MMLASICQLLLASSFALASPLEERAVKSGVQLFAYGGGRDDSMGGLPVFYADGTAYIGQVVPSGASVVSNITMTWTSASEAAVINSNTTRVNWAATKYLFVDTADDAFEPLQIVATAPSDDYTNTGFVFYGSTLFRKADSGIFESLFYAKVTTQDGLYKLAWNAAENDDADAIPVGIRTTPPSTHFMGPDDNSRL
ncbi:uncharacterized protein K452DRAFT_288471 [Aplosporella prunicola CBS 121167]|uniref:Uncharacterized protein n=1 Tax=Aplosporella prunicola CBS 121167 TaxID=1176127 RepID=A0A6A6B9Z2_9PEZI|nr:uncharacterized protein K452DRAFT_288471 [Aplosporella prunicola CBS 121167]KAF2141092.1 hypothetical protein K452DRAFT_288471 [Aplosporella prunicola CBS 121167]